MQTYSESLGVELFNRLGRVAATERYMLLCDIARSRYETHLLEYGSIPNGFTAIDYLNPEELQERYILGLGIQLCVNEKQEATERVLARCLARKRTAKMGGKGKQG